MRQLALLRLLSARRRGAEQMASEMDRLRAEVRARHAAATKKVSRLRRVSGIEIGETAYDPRRDLGNVKRYNRGQLRAYLAELDSFTSRSTGFVAGSGGQPIPRAQWNEYKRLERQFNRKAERRFGRVENIALPSSDPKEKSSWTVGDRQRRLRPEGRTRMAGEAFNNPFEKRNRQAFEVQGEAGLRTLIRDMQKRNRLEYGPKELKRGRRELDQMLKFTGYQNERAEAKKLSDEQFELLWMYTDFAQTVSRDYNFWKESGGSPRDEARSKIAEDDNVEIGQRIQWAKTALPPTSRRKAR